MFEMRRGGLVRSGTPRERCSSAVVATPGLGRGRQPPGLAALLVGSGAGEPDQFPSPRRMAVGLEMNRVVLLLAFSSASRGLHSATPASS